MKALRFVHPRSAAWPLLACAALAWWAFSPGLFSPDSIDQIQQAFAWSFDDWHPPFPAMLAGLLFKLGLPVAGLTFLLALAWALACGMVMDALMPRSHGTLDDSAPGDEIAAERGSLSLFWFLLLSGWALLPPWPFYAVTFWKDCGTAIGLLLLIAGLLRAAALHPAEREKNARGSVTLAASLRASFLARGPQALMLAGSLLAALSRHNAGVLLPLAGLGIALAEPVANCGAGGVSGGGSGDSPRKALPRLSARIVGFLLPFVLVFAVSRLLPVLAPIAEKPIGAVVMAHELAIAVHADPELAASLPYTAASIATRYPVTIERGDLAALVGRTWWLGPDLGQTLDPALVRDEYLTLLRTRPLLVAELKLLSWINLWNTTGSTFWHQAIIEPNELGLQWSTQGTGLREAWLTWSRELWQNPPTRFLLAGHFPWMIGSVLIALAALFRVASRRDTASTLALLAALAPPTYALSFLATYAVADYRYLYPTTLAVQVLFLGLTRSALVLQGQARRSPPPRSTAPGPATPGAP